MDSPQQQIAILQEEVAIYKSLYLLVLDINWLTTTEFCEKYKVDKPIFTGQVESSVYEFLRVDAIKWHRLLDAAKIIRDAKKPDNDIHATYTKLLTQNPLSEFINPKK